MVQDGATAAWHDSNVARERATDDGNGALIDKATAEQSHWGKAPPLSMVKRFTVTVVSRCTRRMGEVPYCPSRVISPPPSMLVLFGTVSVEVSGMVTGLEPHRNRIVPPPLDAAMSNAICNVSCVQRS